MPPLVICRSSWVRLAILREFPTLAISGIYQVMQWVHDSCEMSDAVLAPVGVFIVPRTITALWVVPGLFPFLEVRGIVTVSHREILLPVVAEVLVRRKTVL